MEDTLRAIARFGIIIKHSGLNPCFNGRYSQSLFETLVDRLRKGLNPCFNGRYSQSLVRAV